MKDSAAHYSAGFVPCHAVPRSAALPRPPSIAVQVLSLFADSPEWAGTTFVFTTVPPTWDVSRNPSYPPLIRNDRIDEINAQCIVPLLTQAGSDPLDCTARCSRSRSLPPSRPLSLPRSSRPSLASSLTLIANPSAALTATP